MHVLQWRCLIVQSVPGQIKFKKKHSKMSNNRCLENTQTMCQQCYAKQRLRPHVELIGCHVPAPSDFCKSPKTLDQPALFYQLMELVPFAYEVPLTDGHR